MNAQATKRANTSENQHKQKILINKTFGSARYTYNYYLDKMINNGYVKPYANI